MAQVGEFPAPIQPVTRAPISPYDRSTIISILPHRVININHTVFPGEFIVEPGTFDKPSVLVIGPSSWFRFFGDDQPVLEIPHSSIVMADSVVQDYCKGMLGCDMESAIPGLFYTPGEVSVVDVKLKYKAKLAEVKAKQDNWFRVLVRIADSLWARTNGNPLVIWDEMRIGARTLGMDDKPWLKDFNIVDKVKCFACGNLRDPAYPICPNCRVIDPTHPLADKVKFAG